MKKGWWESLAFIKGNYTVTRHVCPRNCYDTCGMLAYTKNGILQKVEGDPLHGYTKGKLCTKGYAYVNRVYHSDRLKYPLVQSPRGSGQMKIVSWDTAMNIICEKILELQHRYGSNLSLALNKYSGNFGILHYAAEGLFNSLSPTTQTIGSPCWSAGLDAHYYDFGNFESSDPEEMSKAKLIILWGVNPAWTAVHSLPYIFQAKKNGAKIVVIDPVYTTSAKKADLYIQLTPGSDGTLALAIIKFILTKELEDKDFIAQYTFGFDKLKNYLDSFSIREAALGCGQKVKVIEMLAEMIALTKPAFIWTGFGLQRYLNGGQNIRAINAIAAITGNIGISGGGVHYAHQSTNKFSQNIHNFKGNNSTPSRFININNFADETNNLHDPPIKFLWLSCRNLVTQDPNQKKLLKALKNLELIVTVDQFLTPTAQISDVVLPTTTHFEELDVVPSYWHHWVGINQQAINPYYESKSDLQIAQLLSQKLNQLKPNSCSFPESGRAEDFLELEFNTEMYDLLGITHWTDLIAGPKRASIPITAWAGLNFKTPTKKYEFYSERAEKNGLSPMPVVVSKKANSSNIYPYYLLTPHSQHGINSQFLNLSWILKLNVKSVVIVSPMLAKKKNIKSGNKVKVFNNYGQVVVKASISKDVPPNAILFYQSWIPNKDISINSLVPGHSTDMGKVSTGTSGVAFYETFVDIEKVYV